MARMFAAACLVVLAFSCPARAQYGGSPGYPATYRPANYVAGPFLRVPEHEGFYAPKLWLMPYPVDLGPVPLGILVQIDPARPFHPMYQPSFGRGWSYMPPGMERGSPGPNHR